MTLKKAVEDRTSPLRRFLGTRLPNTRAVRTRWAEQAVETAHLPPPAGSVLTPDGRDRPYPSDEVGHAASLRMSLLFSPQVHAATEPPAWHPITGEPWPAAEAFADEFVRTLATSAGFAPLPDDRERRLAQLCFVGGLFDQMRRIGPQPELPLLQIAPDLPVDDLLSALAPAPCVQDLLALAETARARLSVFAGVQPVAVGPVFAGSRDVGGADADVIVGPTLLELKTRGRLELQQRHLHQIVGYALLDYDDEYGITELALYSARHGSLVRWPLADVLGWLAGGPADVASLRSELRTQLRVA